MLSNLLNLAKAMAVIGVTLFGLLALGIWLAKTPSADAPQAGDDADEMQEERPPMWHAVNAPAREWLATLRHTPPPPGDYADYPAQGEPLPPPVEVLPPFPDLDQAHIEAMRDRWAAIPLEMH